jgi:hypothetical protein
MVDESEKVIRTDRKSQRGSSRSQRLAANKKRATIRGRMIAPDGVGMARFEAGTAKPRSTEASCGNLGLSLNRN